MVTENPPHPLPPATVCVCVCVCVGATIIIYSNCQCFMVTFLKSLMDTYFPFKFIGRVFFRAKDHNPIPLPTIYNSYLNHF